MFLPVPQHKILETLFRFRYLSSFQLAALLYPSALKYVQNHLSKLYANGYLERHLKYRAIIGGRPLSIYSLKGKAYSYLGAKARKSNPSQQSLIHLLSANDLLILAHQLVRKDPYFSITHYLTEHEIKVKSAGICPDAALVIETSTHHYPIAFELDRASEDRPVIQAKISSLIDYSQGPHRAHLPSDYLTIAFVVHGSDRRVEQLVRWTEGAIQKRRAQDLASIFLFAQFDPSTADPVQIFTQPIWSSPLTTIRHILLP
jgi:hypothetical protein